MAEKKSNLRSFRYSDRVAQILEQQQGDSLNEKFENLVLYCYDKLPSMEFTVKLLSDQIEERRRELACCDTQIRLIESIMDEMESIKWSLEMAVSSSKSLCNTMPGAAGADQAK